MAPALTKDITTRSTEGLPVSPPIVTSVETSVVRQPLSLKEDLQSRLLSTGFGISTQATQLTASLIVSPREKGKPLVVSSSRVNRRMNPPVNGIAADSTNPSQIKSKTLNSNMGLTPADHPKPSCSSKPDAPQASTSSNGVNSLHKTSTRTTATTLNIAMAPLEQVIPPSADASLSHSSVAVGQTLEGSMSACESRQRVLQKRTGRILRRLRRLQNWQAISHVRQQMTGLVDYQQNTLHLQAKAIDCDDGKSTVLQDKNVKSMSTSALVSLVQSWQSRHGQPASRASKSTPEPEPQTKLDEDLCVELDRVGGNLRSNLHHLEEAVDSDATESSSGGESCDDMDYEDWDGKSPRPSLTKRAEWLWSEERSRIAAKWTWLQAQVSDLEYRIRQQNNIYRQVRQAKGVVVLADPPTPSTSQAKDGSKTVEASPLNVSQVLNNMDKQAATLTNQLGNVYSPAVSTGMPANGFVSPATTSSPSDIPDLDTTCVAARCRPLKGPPRQRKLLRTAGLHLYSRKAARPSTVKCGCYPPRPPCAMCGGRYNNTQPLQPYTMPQTEKLALLDPAYHPVLSSSEDAPLALQFEMLLKTGEWQQQKQTSKGYNKMAQYGSRSKSQTAKDKPRKYNKRIPKSVSAAMLNRIKSKYEQKQLARGGNATAAVSSATTQKAAECNGRLPLKIRKRKGGMFSTTGTGSGMRKRARVSGNNRHCGSQQAGGEGGGDLGRSGDSSMLRDLKDAKKRRMENAFDINNIVIPYSIAAATRVEKPQYKEIATPKWRELGGGGNNKSDPAAAANKNPASSSAASVSAAKPTKETVEHVVPGVKLVPDLDIAINGVNKIAAMCPSLDSSDTEDLSEDCVVARHNRCEVAEKKKFLSYMVAQRRGRGHRTDSTTTDPQENGDDANLPSAATVIAELNSYGRQRQPSCSLDPREEEEFSANTVAPWPMRSFPMTQKDFDDMEREAEVAAAAAAAAVSRRRTSTLPSSVASEEVVDEEWAVQGNTDKLVLRLTKR